MPLHSQIECRDMRRGAWVLPVMRQLILQVIWKHISISVEKFVSLCLSLVYRRMPGPTQSNLSCGTATLDIGNEDGQEGEEWGEKSQEAEAGSEAREAVSNASACQDERPPPRRDSIDAGRNLATASPSAG